MSAGSTDVIDTAWQDLAITGITILFAVMLLPQLRDGCRAASC